MAGDGYMASNERIIEFGLGNVGTVEEATIHWPSGGQSTLISPQVNCTYIIVEDLEVSTRLDSTGATSFPVAAAKNGKP
jgi:hypothetical protein